MIPTAITNVEVPDWIHHGDSAEMKCIFDTGAARITWARTELHENYNSEKVVLTYSGSRDSWDGPEKDRMTGNIVGNTCTLTIHSVNWQIDEGKYWCRIINDVDFSEDIKDGNTTVSGK